MAKKILIVESGITVIPFEETLLLRRDHDVKRAASGKQALEYFAKEKFDLLIMDDRLPDFKAEELVDKIRSEPYGKDLSIIEMSAEQERPPRGVNNLLRKPIESGEFNETCKKLLQVESRRESRLLVYVQVQGFIQSNFFLCNSRNLSSSGILILTTKHLKLGDNVQLQITLPREKEKVKAFARVIREAKEVDSRLNAYGLHFTEIAEKDKERVRKFLKELREEKV
ncbi:MAG TPA: response regulator [Acidobacteriota bacterium]|jgi:CheY-like chemotaxis protein|nr:response regulator [Acidobacteriota bacterium]HNT16807.1 response regulator [Acidobacteriota bacterium]HPA26932.1 response regulator [Acidobacteriota bacterium]HQO19350.1 response regulator [Acidobacteriota bacterium]HQQ47387.1 response regulator [Acidobacteriota bacterium]